MPGGVVQVWARLGPAAVADIALIALSIYWLLLLIRGTTAMTVLRGVAVLLGGAFVISRIFDLRVVNWILRNSVTGLLIGLTVVFQPEIRRALERLGRTGARSWRRAGREQLLDAVARGALRLARQRHGALIVIERETGLQDVIDTGITLDATLSEDLLAAIFAPNAALHDGACVIRLDRIVAAGCTLPLSESALPSEMGMRHRSALGLTERTDAVVVVVSEERGEITIASNGTLRAAVDEAALLQQLYEAFGLTDAAPAIASGDEWTTS